MKKVIIFLVVALILGIIHYTTFRDKIVYKYDGAINVKEVNTHIRVKPEYIIELINQDEVLIQCENAVYRCHFDEIQQVIEQDNL